MIMGNYEQLKDAVTAVIKANGKKEITGQILQDTLLAMINSLGSGAVFAGIATPSTKPGTPDQNVFYIAGQNGTYTNFGSVILKDEIATFTIKNGTWQKETLVNILDASQGNRALYVAAGAVYNEQTGFYELNGLTDISETQMRVIYNSCCQNSNVGSLQERYSYSRMRTNLRFGNNYGAWIGGFNTQNMCYSCTSLEILAVSSDQNFLYINNCSRMFLGCSKLKTILGGIKFNSTISNYTLMFSGCALLETIKCNGIAASISFIDSPLLSLESLQYLITNAANTSAITVTVHADVYAKIQDETQTEWHALIEQAQEKNITFATA